VLLLLFLVIGYNRVINCQRLSGRLCFVAVSYVFRAVQADDPNYAGKQRF